MTARQLPADKEAKHAKERSVLTCKLAHVVPCLLLPDLLSAVLSDLTSNLAVAFPVLSTGTQYTTHTHHHQDLFCASDDTVVGVGGGPQQRNFSTAANRAAALLCSTRCSNDVLAAEWRRGHGGRNSTARGAGAGGGGENFRSLPSCSNKKTK